MDWIAASVIVSAIGIIVTIVITSRATNKELRHNRFLQDRDSAIRLLHEEERPKIYVTYRGARYVKADELLRSKRAREQIKALAKIDFKRTPAKTENHSLL